MIGLIFFIIGVMLGGLTGVVIMCCLQINRLTEREEAEQLYSLVQKSGCSKEAFLRGMVKGYRLCEKPDPEFYKIMRELSAIGNRINQLAAKANALNFVDAPMLKEEARRWHEFQIAVRKKYLLPRKAP